MILEREQWHLGYASLLRDCRGLPDGGGAHGGEGGLLGGGGGVGRALLLVHPDADAMASARILSYMLRADGVPYQMRPCTGWERLKSVLTKVRVVVVVSVHVTRRVMCMQSVLFLGVRRHCLGGFR